jgi:putative tricarboxylic transport membrane protein
MILALMSLALLMGGSVRKGLFATMLGCFLATIGTDPITSIPRLNFGTMALRDGLPLVPVITGLFAFSELLIQFGQGVKDSIGKKELQSLMKKSSPDDHLSFREFLSCWREMLVGSIIGAALGALPGPGATMSAFTSYGIAGKWEKNKGRMGTGIVEGVAAAESADSATVGPTLIPLLTFGIPGSGTAALFGAALILQGMTPGPGLFTDHMNLIYALFVLMITGTAMNLFISKITIIPVFSRLALIERRLLVAILAPMMAVGIYSINLRPFDVLVMFLAGILGLVLRRIKIAIAPVAVAMIVVPILETQFRRALILSQGDLTYFVQSPIACGFFLVVVLLCIYIWRKNS